MKSKTLVYPNDNLMSLCSPSHPVFLCVEKMFDNWIECAPSSTVDCYTGWGEDEPAVFDKVGAIRQAIENMIDEATETNQPVNVLAFDVECAFE